MPKRSMVVTGATQEQVERAVRERLEKTRARRGPDRRDDHTISSLKAHVRKAVECLVHEDERIIGVGDLMYLRDRFDWGHNLVGIEDLDNDEEAAAIIARVDRLLGTREEGMR